MEKILLALLLGGIAAGMPGQAIADNGTGLPIAGQAPLFAPPPYGADMHVQPLFMAPPSVRIAPAWRERNDWAKRRTDQWSELEWQRQQWRENRGEATTAGNPLNTGTSQDPASSNSF
ncbi:hypothetical protein [Collimonas humicola]|uniref:hypothetical protein n=1 Tax=Collimonas humicola TaxID=2825886 RepID=UPI001B8CE5B6|nr:hypothetical protein [Collimonas humicola]